MSRYPLSQPPAEPKHPLAKVKTSKPQQQPVQQTQPSPQEVQNALAALSPAMYADLTSLLQRINPAGLSDMVQKAQDNGDPIFTLDSLRTTQQPLALILRLLFINNHVTRKKFEQLHRKMAQESCMATNTMSYARNNMLRSLPQTDITWNFLEKICAVMGFNILDMTLTLQKKETGEVFTVSKSEALDLVKDNPYPPNIVVSKATSIQE